MRIQSVRLEDACRFVGPVRPNPGVQEEDPMAHVPARPRAPALSDFCGATNIPGSDMWNELGVGWGRHDFSWGAIEPAQDQWRFSEYDQMVLQAHRYGLEILPMLGYSAPWAVAEGASGFAPPRNVADWEDFVETCVARYSRPPFNLRYFQVWNEPTLKAGFWKGETDDEFFERVYLPAARIIRRYGCKVVFSGWPCSDGVDALAALLDKYEAWRVTDTLDIHYYTLADMLKLYDRYVRTGKCEGIWQTEVGYHPFEGYLPNLYCRLLWFGLKEGWTDPNRFKLFWYAFWGAGPDADKCLTCPGNEGAVPSETHGARMLALKQVLGDGQLSAFGDFETTPAVDFSTDEEIPSVEGFRCGDRVVIAFQLDPAMERLAICARLARPPASVARVDSVGRRRELQCAYADGLATVEVPLDDLQPLLARNWGNEVRYRIGYVVME